MIHAATYIKDIVIQDPDTGGDVEVTVFKHQNGGIIALDASYLDQVAKECSSGNPVVPDPFGDLEDNVNDLVLEYPEENFYLSRVESLLRQGKRLQAIKAYKDATGMGLRDSKLVVDGIEFKIKNNA